MSIKIAKVTRNADGLMTSMVQEEVPYDTIEAYEAARDRDEFLRAFHGDNQERFNAVIKRRIEAAVTGPTDWRAALEAEVARQNAWLRADWQDRKNWQERSVNVGFGDDGEETRRSLDERHPD